MFQFAILLRICVGAPHRHPSLRSGPEFLPRSGRVRSPPCATLAAPAVELTYGKLLCSFPTGLLLSSATHASHAFSDASHLRRCSAPASLTSFGTGVPPSLRSGFASGCSVPEGIRTPDPRLRRPLLYPAELRTHSLLVFT